MNKITEKKCRIGDPKRMTSSKSVLFSVDDVADDAMLEQPTGVDDTTDVYLGPATRGAEGADKSPIGAECLDKYVDASPRGVESLEEYVDTSPRGTAIPERYLVLGHKAAEGVDEYLEPNPGGSEIRDRYLEVGPRGAHPMYLELVGELQHNYPDRPQEDGGFIQLTGTEYQAGGYQPHEVIELQPLDTSSADNALEAHSKSLLIGAKLDESKLIITKVTLIRIMLINV